METGQRGRKRKGDGGEAFSRSFELVATPAVFAVIGLLVDRWLGTAPLFVIVLTVFGIVGAFVSTWYRYDHEMRQHETRRALAPSRPSGDRA